MKRNTMSAYLATSADVAPIGSACDAAVVTGRMLQPAPTVDVGPEHPMSSIFRESTPKRRSSASRSGARRHPPPASMSPAQAAARLQGSQGPLTTLGSTQQTARR
jgi:hypothetical protein